MRRFHSAPSKNKMVKQWKHCSTTKGRNNYQDRESDTALYGTTNRLTNRSPLDFIGSGIRFTLRRTRGSRRFDDWVLPFATADDIGSSGSVRDYENEVFISRNVVIRHKFERGDHLTPIAVVFLYGFTSRLTEEADVSNLSEDTDRSAWRMFENDIGLKFFALDIADLCDTR